MPHFFFDTDDGTSTSLDSEGLNLPDCRAAREAALKALPDMARDLIPDGDERTFVVKVRDGSGRVIYTATLSLKGEWAI